MTRTPRRRGPPTYARRLVDALSQPGEDLDELVNIRLYGRSEAREPRPVAPPPKPPEPAVKRFQPGRVVDED